MLLYRLLNQILNQIEVVPIYIPTAATALRPIYFFISKNKHATWLIHIKIMLIEFPAITQPFQGLGSVRYGVSFFYYK